MKKAGVITSQIITFAILAASTVHAEEIIIDPPNQVLDGTISPNSVVSFVIGALVAIGVIAAVIWLIIGAIRWVTSGGDKTKVESARNHIIAAIVGLVIIVLSLVIINVVAKILGVSDGFLKFDLPTLG